MNEELRKAIADYFDAGDFAEFIGVTVEDLLDAFPKEVEENLDEITEIMGLRAQYTEEDEA